MNDRDDRTGVALPEAAIEALEAGRRRGAIAVLTDELRLDEAAARERIYGWAAAAIAGAVFFYVVIALP